MRVLCVVEHGNAPSTRLRLRECLDQYARLGLEVTVLTTRRSSMVGQLKIIQQARHHDVVVLFKTLGFTPLELALLHRANPRIIFDFGDAVMFREQKHGRPLNFRPRMAAA